MENTLIQFKILECYKWVFNKKCPFHSCSIVIQFLPKESVLPFCCISFHKLFWLELVSIYKYVPPNMPPLLFNPSGGMLHTALILYISPLFNICPYFILSHIFFSEWYTLDITSYIFIRIFFFFLLQGIIFHWTDALLPLDMDNHFKIRNKALLV